MIYDYLVNTDLLKYVPASAEFIDVGKKGGHAHISQEQINALIVEKAKSGMRVARLKGGDPFIFGRGGEEAAALAEAGIRFEVDSRHYFRICGPRVCRNTGDPPRL